IDKAVDKCLQGGIADSKKAYAPANTEKRILQLHLTA
ncbi:hypothetical protein HKBW3S42_02384, partial [Candidatus Hakubella thermalkaliphila]